MSRRVALDIGAADPSAALDAASRALEADPDLHLVVVGPPSRVDATDGRLTWQVASPPDPHMDPAVAVRGQADLSVRVALEMGRDGAVDTVLSASPTAALLTAARFLLRRRIGVRNPLVATTVRTDGGAVVVLDTSGRAGTTAGALATAAGDLGALPDPVGLLEAGGGDPRAAATLADIVGVGVEQVRTATVLSGELPLVFADGAAGSMLVDTIAALAPERLGPRRLVGLADTPPVFALGHEPAEWELADLLTAAVRA